MFSLSDGRLIRLNKDGTNGEIILSKKTTIVLGTSLLDDHHIKDVDPSIEVKCEIYTDNLGRVLLVNKSANEIFLNDKPVTSVRQLLNNSIIKICDGVKFRWTFKEAKENFRGDLNDADFASWSDPARKQMKQTKTSIQRPKGRLTVHPLNAFSSAMDSSADSIDEEDTGCSVLPDSDTASNVPANESHALINFSVSEPHIEIPCESSEHSKKVTDASLVMNAPESDETMQQQIECTISNVKAQPSDCSVITLSSDGSQEVGAQETPNNDVELDDEDMFERSISCPPSELQDELFDNSLTDETDKQIDLINNDTYFETTVEEASNIEDEIFETSKPEAASTSIDNFASNDEDIVIPETQEMFSQESDESLSSLNNVSQHDSSKVENITKYNQLPPNMSVMSISSDEEPEISQITFKYINDSIIKTGDISIKCNQAATELKNETEVKELEKSAHIEQSSAAEFDDSSKLFSQSLVDGFFSNSANSSNFQLLDNKTTDGPESECSNTLNNTNNSTFSTSPDAVTGTIPNESLQVNECAQDNPQTEPKNVDSTLMPDDLVIEAEKSNLTVNRSALFEVDTTKQEVIHNKSINEVEINDDVTQSAITVDISDTTQRLDCPADFSNVDEMDKLEFSSESLIDSNDSGLSCPNTSTNATEYTNQTNSFGMRSDEDVSIPAMSTTETDTSTHSIGANDDDNVGDSPSSEKEITSNAEVKPTDIDSSGGTPVLDTITAAESENSSQENTSSVSINVASINDQSTHDVATFSTPAKIATRSDKNRCLTIPRATQRKPILDVASATPRRTPRKFNVSQALSTPSKSEATSLELTIKDDVIAEVLQIKEDSEVISTQIIPVEGNKIEEDSDDDALLSMPTVSRSVRHKRVVEVESTTPRRTPNKLNVTLALSTPSLKLETAQADSMIELSEEEKPAQNIDIAAISTPMKTEMATESNQNSTIFEIEPPIHVSLAPDTTFEQNSSSVAPETFEGSNETKANKDGPTEANQEMPTDQIQVESDDKASDNIEPIHSYDNAIAQSTPAKPGLITDVHYASATRSSRRQKAKFEAENATPKWTPRKLNIRLAVNTPKLEKVDEPTQDKVESNLSESLSKDDTDNEFAKTDVVESVASSSTVNIPTNEVPNQVDSEEEIGDIASEKADNSFAPSKSSTSLNQTQSTSELEEQNREDVSSEIVPNQDIPIIHTESTDEQIETANVEIPHISNTTQSNIVFTTPTKIESASETNSAVKRSTRRQQALLKVETPITRRTPRKLNTSLAISTPLKLVDEPMQDKVESNLSESLSKEDTEIGSAKTDVVESVASLSMVELVIPSNDVPNQVDSEEEINKNVTEKADNSFAPSTSLNKTKLSSKLEEQNDEDVSSEIAQNPDNSTMQTKSTGEQIEPTNVEIQQTSNTTQSHESNFVFSTPAKIELAGKTDSAVKRSTRRQQALHKVETPITRRTPRKLNDSLAAITPSRLETKNVETMQEMVESVSDETASQEDIEIATSKTDVVVEHLTSPADIELFVPSDEKQNKNDLEDEVGDSMPEKLEQLVSDSDISSNDSMIEFSWEKHSEDIFSEVVQSQDIFIAEIESSDEQIETANIETTRVLNTTQSNEANVVCSPPTKLELTSETNSAVKQPTRPQHTLFKDGTPIARRTQLVDTTTSNFATKENESMQELDESVLDETGSQEDAEIATSKTDVVVVENLTSPSNIELFVPSDEKQNKNDLEDEGGDSMPEKLEQFAPDTSSNNSQILMEEHSEDIFQEVEQNQDNFIAAIKFDEQIETANVQTPQILNTTQSNEAHHIVLSTPAKIDLASETNSADKRSTRRQHALLKVETPITRRTPRKLNTSLAISTPLKFEKVDEPMQDKVESNLGKSLSKEDNEIGSAKTDVDESVASLSMVELVIPSNDLPNRADSEEQKSKSVPEKADNSFAPSTSLNKTQLSPELDEQNDEDVSSEIAQNPDNFTMQTKSTGEQIEPTNVETPQTSNTTRVHESNIVFTTPAKIDLASETNSAVKRSTRRQHALLKVETPITRRTPRKLNVSAVPVTTGEPGTPSVAAETFAKCTEGEIQKPALEDDSTVQIESSEGHLQTVDVDAPQTTDENLIKNSQLPTTVCKSIEIFSTPAKLEFASTLSEQGNSTATRSTRRNRANLEVASTTVEFTPKKSDVQESISKSKSPELNVNAQEKVKLPIESTPAQCESTVEHVDFIETAPKHNEIIEATQSNEQNDVSSTPVKANLKRSQSHLRVATPITKRTPRRMTMRANSSTPRIAELPSGKEQNEEPIVEQCENVIADTTQNADDVITVTPAKPEFVIKPTDECSSAKTRSSKRKLPNIDLMPAAKRATRMLSGNIVHNTPSKNQVAEEKPENVGSKDIEDKAGESLPVHDNIGSSTTVGTQSTRRNRKILDVEALQKVETPKSQKSISDDKVIDKTSKVAKDVVASTSATVEPVSKSDENHSTTAIRSSRRKQTKPKTKIVDDEHISKTTETSLDTETSSPKVSMSAPKKRSKFTTAEVAEVQNDKVDEDPNSDMVLCASSKSTLEKPKKHIEPASHCDSTQNPSKNKRLGTPLPANKKRAFLLTEKMAGTSAVNPTDDRSANAAAAGAAEEQPVVESSKKTAKSTSKSKVTSDGDTEAITTAKSSRRRKMTDAVETKSVEKQSDDEDSAISLIKRNRNLTIDANKDIVPSTSKSAANKNADEPAKEAPKEQSRKIAASPKPSRRKRTNTEIDTNPMERTPKKQKTHLDHVLEAVATPSSSRSLRSRVIVINDEISSSATETATPKRTRRQRKAPDNSNKTSEISEFIDLTKNNESQSEQPVQSEKVEKPKRQARRKATTKEESNENVVDEVEAKKPRRVAKRTKTSATDVADQPATTVITEPIDVPSTSGRRARNNTKNQPQTEPATVETEADSSEPPVAKKSTRGRPKKNVEEDVVEESETQSKRRKVRAPSATNKDHTEKKQQKPSNEATKKKATKMVKADIIVEADDEPTQPKRGRTRKVQESDTETSAKNNADEKPAKKSRKVAASTADLTRTSPISTRTRRHK